MRKKADPWHGALVSRGNLQCIEMGVFSEQFPELDHGFTTRRGAGRRVRGRVDFRESPEGNAKIFRQSLGDLAKELGLAQKRIVYPRQEHGTRVLVIRKEGPPPGDLDVLRARRADAIITNLPGLAIGVRTADCVPILLYDQHSGAVAAVHAGWRGTAGNILEKTLRLLSKEFHCDPRQMVAAIGPAIGFDSFEVEEPVLSHFRERFDFWSRFARPTRNNRWLIDLKMINAYLLASAGVEERNLGLSPLCTVQEQDLFYSYRREGEETGRMLNFIEIKPQ